jgi:hypothetical protein
MHVLHTPRRRPGFLAIFGSTIQERRDLFSASSTPPRGLAALHSVEQLKSGYRRVFSRTRERALEKLNGR